MDTIPNSLAELVQKSFKKRITVARPRDGVKVGDNVVGKMAALEVQLEDDPATYNIIVKSAINFAESENLSRNAVLFYRAVDALQFFQTELAFYCRVSPKLAEIGCPFPHPRVYLAEIDEDQKGKLNCLVLEDIRPQGFGMVDKRPGLDLDHVKLVLKHLAVLHAGSSHLISTSITDPEFPSPDWSIHVNEKFAHHVGEAAQEVHRSFFNNVFSGSLAVGFEENEIPKELYEKIKKIAIDPWSIIVRTSHKAQKEYFKVASHGDLWTNNILFKHDAHGNPIDVSFVDFQQSRYSSVYDDLHYFIYTSTTPAFRKEHLKTILTWYCDCFREALENLNPASEILKQFTHDKCLEGFNTYAFGGFCYNVFAIPFQLGVPKHMGSGGDGEVENNDEEITPKVVENHVMKMFENMVAGLVESMRNSPLGIQRLGEFCKEMDQQGVFGEI